LQVVDSRSHILSAIVGFSTRLPNPQPNGGGKSDYFYRIFDKLIEAIVFENPIL